MYLVGFIVRIYHDARSPERQRKQMSKFRKAIWVGKREGTTDVRCKILCRIGASDRFWRKLFPSGLK